MGYVPFAASLYAPEGSLVGVGSYQPFVPGAWRFFLLIRQNAS